MSPPPGTVTWLGHATVLVDAGGVRVLTDPLLRSRVAHLRRHTPVPETPARLDAVLLSHLHRDHADAPSLRLVPGDVPVLVPHGAGATVRRMGAGNVRELRAGDRAELAPGVAVRAVPAVHDGRRAPWSRDRPDALGYVVEAGAHVYFAGDTELYDGMADAVGHADLALLPIWGWGTGLGPGHMDPGQAARAAALLRPGLVVPIHWATYLPFHLRRHRGLLTTPGEEFARLAAELAPGVPVEVVRPGSTVAVPARV
jgi:L-ascorbate metabolism protein UlaG (beta-lactamase superfamily)